MHVRHFVIMQGNVQISYTLHWLSMGGREGEKNGYRERQYMEGPPIGQ